MAASWGNYARTGATALAAAVIAWICVDQGRYYFATYGNMTGGPSPLYRAPPCVIRGTIPWS